MNTDDMKKLLSAAIGLFVWMSAGLFASSFFTTRVSVLIGFIAFLAIVAITYPRDNNKAR